MALRASYYGVKRDDAVKLKKIPGIVEIGDGLTLSNDGTLTGDAGTVVANPEDEATGTLNKLQVGETVYTVPGNDNTKCYQTDDGTESNIVDADYVPFYDASASAPKKSTWSNFVSKIQAKLTAFVDWSSYAKTGVHNMLPDNIKSQTGSGTFVITDDRGIITLNGKLSSDTDFYYIGVDTTHYDNTGLASGNYSIMCEGISSAPSNDTKIMVIEEGGTLKASLSKNSVGEKETFTLDGSKGYRIFIRVVSTDTFDNLTLKPMLVLANDTETSFVPYAMTNKELTDAVTPVVLGSNDDLNNITKMGVYIVAGSPANTPDNKGFYALLVYPIAADGMSVIQIALHGENAIYYRRRSGSPVSWKPWVKVEGTVIS